MENHLKLSVQKELFSFYPEFLRSKYLATVSFILKIQAINLSILLEHMLLLFVN